MYRLKRLYSQLRAAADRGDLLSVDRCLDAALAVPLDPVDEAVAATLTPMLQYRGFKPAELAMLRANIKPLIKFEDIPISAATAYIEAHRSDLQLVVSSPYAKDYLLLRSRPAGASDPAALVTIYASRDGSASALHQLEQSDPFDVKGAAALLSIPLCCAEAFDTDMRRSRADEDTVNDDACLRVLRSVPAGTGHPALDPLADAELLGFYPCSLRCSAAIQRAEAVFAALRRLDPEAAASARSLLGAPVWFLRLPFWARELDGNLRVNAFPDRRVRPLQQRFGRRLANTLSASPGPLHARRFTFAPWPETFF